MNKCQYCNSTNLQADITIGESAEVGAIGLQYKTKFIVIGVEPFYAELCQDCGSINRLYVKKTARKWCLKVDKSGAS